MAGAFTSGLLLRGLKQLKTWSFWWAHECDEAQEDFVVVPFRQISWPSCSVQTEPARWASQIEIEIAASGTEPSASDTLAAPPVRMV